MKDRASICLQGRGSPLDTSVYFPSVSYKVPLVQLISLREKKVHLVNWDKVCCTKANGGLGIRGHKTNLALGRFHHFQANPSIKKKKQKNAHLQSDNRLQIHQELDLLLIHLI